MINEQIVEETGAAKGTYSREHAFRVIGNQTNHANVTAVKINRT